MRQSSQFLFILFFISSACSQIGHQSFDVQKVNGMEFSSMTLKNTLEVLLVRDPRFKKASAAMAVGVGSMADPEDAQGLAHYLEHMLFLGTKEFPKPDEYSTYMDLNGGWDNAYTSDEVTNYMFEVDNAALEGALKRFSRFFVSPLLDEKYLEREKNAVHSEFEKNRKQDSWRLDRYINLLAKKDHPFSKFSTGNLTTLKKVNRSQVLEFYEKYYSANNMRLVIMGAQPMEDLRQWAEQHFSDVPNRNVTRPKYDDFFFDPKKNSRLHFIKSIKDRDELLVLFNVADESRFWKSKPLTVLAKLLGDEGEGSLLSYLKSEGLVLELYASENYWRTFGIGMVLTPRGRKEYQRVLSAIENYLKLIEKNLYPEYLFKDESLLRKIALDHLEPTSSGGRAAQFAGSLLEYPARDFLQRNYLMTEYSVDDFKQFLSYLDLQKAHILISSPREKTNRTEKIMGIQYARSKLQLLNTTNLSVLKYPGPNPYVPTDFSMVNTKKVEEKPQKIVHDDHGTVFLKSDTELKMPKASLRLMIRGKMSETPQDAAQLALFVMAKEEDLREWSYPIAETYANFGLSNGESVDEIILSVSGYSQKLDQILRDGILNPPFKDKFSKLKISEKVFNDLKNRFRRELINIEEMVAVQRLSFEARAFQKTRSILWRDVLRSLDSITLRDVQKFADLFFSQIDMTTVAYGNLTEEQVKTMISFAARELSGGRAVLGNFKTRRFEYQVVPDGRVYSVPVYGRNNNWAMMTFYKMAEWSEMNHARALVLGQILSQPYFSELRTHQQLGYVANAGSVYQLGFVGLSAVLQSPKVLSADLQTKSHDFIQTFLKTKMQTLTDEELRPVIRSLRNELLLKPTAFAEREAEFYNAAVKFEGRFSIRTELAEKLEKVTAADLKAFVAENFLNKNPGTLSFLYMGAEGQKEKMKLGGEVINKPSEARWDLLSPYGVKSLKQ